MPSRSAVRYHVALLGRSQRWLPPALLYGGALAIDSASNDYLSDSFGYSAVLILPAVAWLTRAMLTAEPPEARDISSSALGPVPARLGALLAAAGYGLLFAVAGVAAALTAGGAPPSGTQAAHNGTAVTFGLGLAAMVLCILLGTAAGAISAPPLIPATGWSVVTCGVLAIGLIVAPFSPANVVIRALTAPAGASNLSLLLAYPGGLALTAAAWYAAGQVAARR
jgi:hypothetical protein